VAVLCYSCSGVRYIPCIPSVHPDSLNTSIIPLKVGNRWVYNEKSVFTSTVNRVEVEITGLDTVYYIVDNIKKPILAYKVDFFEYNPRAENKRLYYYIKCDYKTVLARADSSNPKVIVEFMSDIAENPAVDMRDSIKPKESRWIGKDTISTEFGMLECFVMQQLNLNYPIGRPINNPSTDIYYYCSKSFFHKGIGLIRVEDYNKLGMVLLRRELTDYVIK
jgi:hypothetical protein